MTGNQPFVERRVVGRGLGGPTDRGEPLGQRPPCDVVVARCSLCREQEVVDLCCRRTSDLHGPLDRAERPERLVGVEIDDLPNLLDRTSLRAKPPPGGPGPVHEEPEVGRSRVDADSVGVADPLDAFTTEWIPSRDQPTSNRTHSRMETSSRGAGTSVRPDRFSAISSRCTRYVRCRCQEAEHLTVDGPQCTEAERVTIDTDLESAEAARATSGHAPAAPHPAGSRRCRASRRIGSDSPALRTRRHGGARPPDRDVRTRSPGTARPWVATRWSIARSTESSRCRTSLVIVSISSAVPVAASMSASDTSAKASEPSSRTETPGQLTETGCFFGPAREERCETGSEAGELGNRGVGSAGGCCQERLVSVIVADHESSELPRRGRRVRPSRSSGGRSRPGGSPRRQLVGAPGAGRDQSLTNRS